MSQHNPHCHSSRWKADGGKEPSLGSRCRCRGEHRALTVLINNEWSDMTITFGHSNPPNALGRSGSFPQAPRRKEQRGDREDLEAEENSELSSEGRNR